MSITFPTCTHYCFMVTRDVCDFTCVNKNYTKKNIKILLQKQTFFLSRRLSINKKIPLHWNFEIEIRNRKHRPTTIKKTKTTATTTTTWWRTRAAKNTKDTNIWPNTTHSRSCCRFWPSLLSCKLEEEEAEAIENRNNKKQQRRIIFCMLHLLHALLLFAWSKGDLWNARSNASVGLFVYIYLSFEFISLLILPCFLFFFFEIFSPRVTVDWCPKFSSPGHVYKTTTSLTTIKCSFPTFMMKMWFSHINFETVQISFSCFFYSGTDVCGSFDIDLKYLLFIFIREMYENISITFHWRNTLSRKDHKEMFKFLIWISKIVSWDLFCKKNYKCVTWTFCL